MVTVGNAGNAADRTGYGSVSDVCAIGKYEVTAGQYTAFLNNAAKTDTYGLSDTNMTGTYGCQIRRSGSSGSYTYSVAANFANRPVNYVSFWDAARFVNWLHNGQGNGDTESGAYSNVGSQSTFARQADAKFWIPTENEWYKAAYHKNDGVTNHYFRYPTGSNILPSNDLVNPDPGNNANFSQGGYTIGSPYWTTEVSEFENSASPCGTFDQGGNVGEWNESIGTGSSWSRVGRGGNWYNGSVDLLASSRYCSYPAYEYPDIGFRVASVPEPGSITLMLCGAVAGMYWWKRRKQHPFSFRPFTLFLSRRRLGRRRASYIFVVRTHRDEKVTAPVVLVLGDGLIFGLGGWGRASARPQFFAAGGSLRSTPGTRILSCDKALVKWYDWTKWLLNRVDSFPKNQRFIFGQRLADRALRVLEILVEAAYGSRKAQCAASRVGRVDDHQIEPRSPRPK